MQKLLLFAFLLTSFCANATLPEGAIAEDFTLDDINGNTHSLYSDYLDQGMSVVIDMSATWCGPCWNFHQSGTMEDIYDDFGPGGDGTIMPMMIEVDGATGQSCFFMSCSSSSNNFGNWSTGINYPLFNPPSAQASAINNDYAITVFPTMYVISPSGYVKPFTGSNTSYEDISMWGAYSFMMENTTYTVDAAGCGDDSIDLHPEGGYGSISYEWSNGATTEDISGLAGGDYYVTMTDDNGYAWEIGPIDVSGFPEMTVDDVYIQDIDCYNNNNGFIDLEIDGGSGNFTYEWSNGDSGPVITDLYAGTYDLTVTDDESGCDLTASYPVFEPDELEINYEVTNVACGETFGEVEFDNDGGTYPFTYLIDGNTYNYDVIDLPAGSYYADITDANGCTESASFTIDETPAPTASAAASGNITCNTTQVTLDGAGSSTGSSVSYSWSDSNGNNLGSSISVTVSTAGNYNLDVLDNNTGCSSSAMVTVSNNSAVPTAMASSSNNLTCTTTSSTITGGGSSTGANITYQWSTANGVISGASNTVSIVVTSAGTYTLLVSDTSNGCNSSTSVDVTQAGLPSFSSSGSTAFCEGSSSSICVPVGANETIEWRENGVVVSTSSCHTTSTSTTYQVLLTNTMSGCTVTETIQTTANALPGSTISGETNFCDGSSTQLCYTAVAGTSYQWMVNNVASGTSECITVNIATQVDLQATNMMTGCSSNSSMTTAVSGSPTASIATPTTIDCNNSSVNLDLSTNSMGSTFAWYDQSGTLISTNEDITVSQAGTYSANVTNTSGCDVTASVNVIADTAVPVISIDPPATITCVASSVNLNLNVNDPNHTISWYDESGTLISNMEDISVSNAGAYTAVVLSTTGCETQSNVIVTADTNLPSASIAAPASLDCNTASVVLDATVANGNNLTWTDAAGNILGSAEDITVTTAGDYTLTVLNNAGCSTSSIVTVSALNNSVAETSFGFTNSEFEFAFSDSSQGDVTSYLWTFGDGNTSTEVNPAYTYMTPGYYTVCLETTNTCGSSTSCNEVLAVATMASDAQTTATTCNGSNDGSVTVIATGGLPGYTYQWSDPAITGDTATDLGPGDYTVIITDATGTMTNAMFTIAEPAALTVTGDITTTSSTTSDGSITLDITGGTGTYSVEWSDGGDGTNLAQGTYTATITDENGCSITETFAVTGSSNVNDIPGLTNFFVSPNPVSDYATVNATFDNTTEIQVSIMNTIGQKELLTTTTTRELSLPIDLTSMAAGIYYVELKTADKIALKKILVSK